MKYIVKIVPYLVLKNGKEGIELYKKMFDAKVISHKPFSKETGPQMGLPEDFDYENSTMHAHLEIFGENIYLSDNPSPDSPSQRSVEVLLEMNSVEQIEKVYANAKKTNIEFKMEFQETFWNSHYASFKDSVGVSWQLNYQKPEEPKEDKKKESPKKKTTSKKKSTKKSSTSKSKGKSKAKTKKKK